METRQHTIKKKVSFAGVGLHSGKRVKLTVKPAPADSGICFVRSDLKRKVTIPAYINRVVNTFLATTISEDNVQISTTEHLLAALNGLGIDNAIIELNNNEVPIMDGSAAPFVRMLHKVNRKRQKTTRKVLKITKEICWRQNGSEIKILPYDGFKITCGIDFDHPLIKSQSYSIKVSPDSFSKEIASARTFGFLEEVEKLQKNGLALGGSLDNAIVVDQSKVLNDEGLRFPDEFVRHKILDLLGDFALLGCQLQGHVIASKTGHTQHLELLKTIADHPECWEFVTFKQNKEDGVFEWVSLTSKAAGNKILPYLVPPGIDISEAVACC